MMRVFFNDERCWLLWTNEPTWFSTFTTSSIRSVLITTVHTLHRDNDDDDDDDDEVSDEQCEKSFPIRVRKVCASKPFEVRGDRGEIQWLAAASAARSLSKYDVSAEAVTEAAHHDDDSPL